MAKKIDDEVFSPTVKSFLEDFSKQMSPDLLEWMGQICDSQIVNWFDQKIDTISVRLVVDSNVVISSLNYYANGKESILFKLAGNPLFKLYVPPELEEEVVDYIENKKKKKTVKKTKLREGWFKLRDSLNIHDEINPKYHRQAMDVIGSRDIDDVPFVAIYLDLGANAILTNDKHYENPEIRKFGIDKLGEIVGSYHQGVFSFFVVYDLLPPVLEFLMKTLFSMVKSLIGYLVIILKVIVAVVAGTVSKAISIISKAPQGVQIFLLAILVGVTAVMILSQDLRDKVTSAITNAWKEIKPILVKATRWLKKMIRLLVQHIEKAHPYVLKGTGGFLELFKSFETFKKELEYLTVEEFASYS